VRGHARRRRGQFLVLSRVANGADAHDLLVDAERGVVLRIASEIDGDPFAVTEFEEIEFDEGFPPSTFSLELPAGEEFASIRSACPEDTTVDEAARRAPFTVLVPRRVPREADVRVSFVPAASRPPVPAGVCISYWVERGAFRLDVTQTAVEDAQDRGLTADGELVERGGRALRVRDVGGQRQLETEHLGTHVLMVSETMPKDLLVEMMLSLEPAPTEPPALI
jgi:hypothetical protein